jgi:S-adenosylmethionine hydrolase
MAISRSLLLGSSLALLLAMPACNPPTSGSAAAAGGPVTPSVNAKPVSQPVIALFTDFGTIDPYVAQMKGAILTIDPDARLLDLTHDVTPFDVAQGSYLLDQSAQEFPAGTIFVAVVDPGVGTERAPLLLKTNQNKFYIGPDNGLFSRVLDREGFAAAWKLDQRAYFRAGGDSHTFQGRDIFGPVAAHLAQGTNPASLGSPLQESALDLPSLHAPEIAGGAVSVEVLHVDHYGNVVLNLAVGGDAAAKFHLGNQVKISVGRENFAGPFVRTYAEGEKGRLIVLYGANGLMEISMNQGSAAQKLKIVPGQLLLLKP